MKKIVLFSCLCLVSTRCVDAMQNHRIDGKIKLAKFYGNLEDFLDSLKIRKESIEEKSYIKLRGKISRKRQRSIKEESHHQSKEAISETSEDAVTSNDAYFAVNGVKMHLKAALTAGAKENIDAEIRTLIDVKKICGDNVLGYKYCLAILCLHFWGSLTEEQKKALGLDGMKNSENRTRGRELMTRAAGGDDDYDAASYLQYNG